jgi:hypothetical protein
LANHSFDIGVAKEVGVECAVLVATIDFWLTNNFKRATNLKNGVVWTTFTPEYAKRFFPYWNKDKVRRLLEKLEFVGYIQKAQFGGSNKAMSYTFTKKFLVKHKESTQIFYAMDGFLESVTVDNFSEKFFNLSPQEYELEDENVTTIPDRASEIIAYWNSKPNLTTHKLPQEGKKPTKLIQFVCNYIDPILDGVYYEHTKLSDTYKAKASSINMDTMKLAIDRLDKMHQPNYFPKSKTNLPNALNTFLYDSHRETSFLLRLIDEEPKKRYVPKADIPKTVIDSYVKMLPDNAPHRWKTMVDGKVIELYKKFEENKWLCNLYPAYRTYLGSFSAFVGTHQTYLKSYSDLTIGHFNTTGKVWDRFVDYVKDNHKIPIDPPNPDILKKRWMQHMIEKRGYSIDDFDENFNLKGEVNDKTD